VQGQQPRQTSKSVLVDALIVATGANQIPKEAPAGLTGFRGRIIHSSNYNERFKREVAEKKLRVLVVGGGESGADISAELGDLSANVTVWLRRAACVGPRYLNKVNEMDQIKQNKSRSFPANAFLEAATTNRMSAGQNVYAYGFFRRLLWQTPVLNGTLARLSLSSTKSAFLMNDQATYVTKNQRMCEALHDQKIEVLVSPTISSRQQTCEFQMPDGTKESRDFDAVVLCTGFRTQFPWLKVEGLTPNPRTWFLHCFPEGLGHCLFFVGYARPHQGGIPVMAEMLSRYIALLLRGERALPSTYASQARQDEVSEREHYFISPNLHTLVDYNAFIESIARRVGCEPMLPTSCILLFNLHMVAVILLALQFVIDLSYHPALGLRLPLLLYVATAAGFVLHDDGLLIKWWFYPNWAVWYRQRGPASNPALLRGVLGRVKLWRSTAITPGFVLLVAWSVPTFYAQRLLSILLFTPHIILEILGSQFPKSWGGLLRPKLFSLHSSIWRVSDLFLP
jgi:dimethylaniline monooxygenase (N-oxide forming)